LQGRSARRSDDEESGGVWCGGRVSRGSRRRGEERALGGGDRQGAEGIGQPPGEGRAGGGDAETGRRAGRRWL